MGFGVFSVLWALVATLRIGPTYAKMFSDFSSELPWFTRVSLNDPGTFTLPIALQNLQSSAVLHYNVLMAGALTVVVPVIVLFLAAQRYFVNGLMGAVKA